MILKLLLFGITTDLLQTSSLEFQVVDNCSVQHLKNNLLEKYPQLKNINSYAIAVNEAYANNDFIIKETDIVAIIPPVSGG